MDENEVRPDVCGMRRMHKAAASHSIFVAAATGSRQSLAQHGNALIALSFSGFCDKFFLNREVYAMVILIGSRAARGAAKRGRNERGEAADGGGREFKPGGADMGACRMARSMTAPAGSSTRPYSGPLAGSFRLLSPVTP
jgi:hypothetical protein